jgi:hypothetical protein
MNSNNVGCEKILNLFRSELVTVNVGPKILATALEKQGYKAIQVDWKPRGATRKCRRFWICWAAWTEEPWINSTGSVAYTVRGRIRNYGYNSRPNRPRLP